MPNATPPTSCASTSAGLTARPTSAPATTRRSVSAPVSVSTSSTTAHAQPAYVIFGNSNDAPAASGLRVAAGASFEVPKITYAGCACAVVLDVDTETGALTLRRIP